MAKLRAKSVSAVPDAPCDASASPLLLPDWQDSDVGGIDDPAAVRKRLEAIEWAFRDDDTSYLTHDVHPYPAKFIVKFLKEHVQR